MRNDDGELEGFDDLAKQSSKRSETDLGLRAALSSSLFEDPTFFVTRRWLTSRVERWLRSDEGSPVLVLTGPPGSGKSRFTYAWATDLANTPGSPQLGALILRDLQAQHTDPFSWPLLRDQLLKLTDTWPSMLSHLSGHAQVGVTMPGSEVTGTKIGRIMGDLVINANDPVREFKNFVLPALSEIPAGDPILIVIDGLDEAFRSSDDDFLAVMQSLADNIAIARRKDSGVGRLRLLVTSQPEVPVRLTPALQPVVIDLARPDASDRDDMRIYVSALLNTLDEANRQRLANVVSEQANGIWAIAFYVANAIAEDVGSGKAPPEQLSSPATLNQVYADALERAEARLGVNWNAGRRLLALVAAAQDVETSLPTDVAAAALGIDGSALSSLLEGMRAVLSEGPDRKLRFFHGDFGRWIIDGGLGESAVFDAHSQLAEVLWELGHNNWPTSGPYCIRYVAAHALAAAELSVGKVTRPRLLSRCLELFIDRERLYADAQAGNWLTQLARLSKICPRSMRLPGSSEPLTVLTSRLYSALELSVGRRLASPFSEEQLEEFEKFVDAEDNRPALAWINENSPNYKKVVHEEFRTLFSSVLAGRPVPYDDGAAGQARAYDYDTAWNQSRKSDYLHAAVAAWQEALDRTPEGHANRTSRLLGLAIALSERLGAVEQDGDLDWALAVRAELMRRDDLADHANDPGLSWSVYASLLGLRWERDPDGHPGDIVAAVQAWQEALDRAPAGHPERTRRLLGLANALIGQVHADQDSDLDRVIDVQGELVRRDDLADHVHDPSRLWAVYASLLGLRWERDPDGHPGGIDELITAWQECLDRSPESHPERTRWLLGLANALIAQVADQDSDLDRVIDVQGELVRRDDLADHVRDPSGPWAVYASLLSRRRERDPDGHPGDVDELITAWRECLDRTPESHPERTRRLVELANALIVQVNGAGQDADLDRVIDVHAELVRRDDLADHVRDPSGPWAVYASLLSRRRKRDPDGHPGDADGAVQAWQECLDRAPEGHPERTRRLLGLADALLAQVNAGQDGDLDRVIDVQAELVRRDDLADHVRDPSGPWAVYASLLDRRWERDPDGHPGDLDGAVQAWQEALDRAPEGHPERTRRLLGLADALLAQVNAGQDGDLDRVIDVHAELVRRGDLADQVHDPGVSWAAYASLLDERREQDPDGHPGDADGAVQAWQEALDRAPEGHPERTRRLVGLADALLAQVNAGQDGDLDRVIDVQAEVVRRDDLADHVRDLSRPWAVYASLLDRRRERDPDGHPGTLDELITAWQECLDRAPEGNPDRTRRLVELADALIAQANAAGQDADLDRAIDVHAELVRRDDLADQVHDPGVSWAAYASLLSRRWERRAGPWKGDRHLAAEAWQEALDRAPEGHPDRTRRLVGLADALIAQVNAGQDGNLDRVIDVHAELVRRDDLAGHVRDVSRSWAVYASLLGRRWERDPDDHPGDADKLITAWQECLDRTPESHPERTRRLAGYANAHLLGYLEGSEIADLDFAIKEAAEVLKTSQTSERESLLPALRRLGRLQS